MCSEKYERAIPAGMGQGGSLGGVAKECFLFRYSRPFSHALFYFYTVFTLDNSDIYTIPHLIVL